MATNVLDSVISNVPDWLKRLEELNGQIERRQQDLAKFAESRPQSSARSIRNRGSTESIRPKDDDAAFPGGAEFPAPDLPTDSSRTPTPTPKPKPTTKPEPIITAAPPRSPVQQHRLLNGPQPPSPPASDPKSGSSVARQTNELVAAAQRRARATVRRRQKTESMIIAEGTTPKYRTRRMVMVYYDSYVQSFFEELVKFVSAQRNLMRKAKMAAKVAQIRRLAELEMPEDEDEHDDEGNESKLGSAYIAAGPGIPAPNSRPGGPDEMRLQYLGTRPIGGALRNPGLGFMPARGMRTSALNGGLGLFNEKGDIWDELDKGLEYVQGMCEHAAHQFLRDGDCNEEIEKIKTRLVKVKESAANEKERMSAETAEKGKDGVQPESRPVLRPEPRHDAVPQAEPTKSRTFRPATVRMGTGASTPSKTSAQDGILEIDEGIEVDMDDFKPVYRSTRLMRRPL
ncbi:hypothetical protein HD806DRAFT_507599 [Xylariaceae sp. AK1471]|nr:hypothetical protein HD806DRAFT_507599 [Xylariaceae sp. AK1471]